MAYRRWQLEAYDAVLAAFRSGVRRPLVHACTGAGKSRLIARFAAMCKGRTLITTLTQALVEQLSATIRAEHPELEVGRCYQRAWEPDARVVVACLPSVEALLAVHPSWACWIADEAHRVEGDDVGRLREQLRAQVAVGLTATPYRADDRALLWDQLVYSYTSYQAIQDGVLVPWRVVRSPESRDVEELTAEWVATADGPGIVSASSVEDAERCAARLGVLAIHGRQRLEEQARRLELLRTGEVKALVHCQLLVEGIDLPWLRWLLLRRVSGSKVRLVQEVGRVLRAHPGKREAVLYDPHDALGTIGLVHGATIESVQQRVGREQEPEAECLEIPEIPGLDRVRTLPRSAAISALEGWATDCVGVLRSAGVVRPVEGLNPDGQWRRRTASDRQRQLAARALSRARDLPPDAAAAVTVLLSQPHLRAGVVSDCLSLLLAARAAAGVQLPGL